MPTPHSLAMVSVPHQTAIGGGAGETVAPRNMPACQPVYVRFKICNYLKKYFSKMAQ